MLATEHVASIVILFHDHLAEHVASAYKSGMIILQSCCEHAPEHTHMSHSRGLAERGQEEEEENERH